MSLRKLAAAGIRWTAISSAFTIVLRMGSLAVLARILSPRDYGLAAMVEIPMGFVAMFIDGGLSGAIIHRQDTTREILSSLYWLNVLIGIVLFTLVCVLAPSVGSYYGEHEVPRLVIWSAFGFILSALANQFYTIMRKELLFDRLCKINMVSVLSGTIVAIIAAANGMGVISLIWGQLASTFLSTVALMVIGLKRWRPMLRFRLSELHGYLSFGFYQLGDRTLNYFYSRIDQILIARILGTETLGLYSIAFNLAMRPVNLINPALTRVAFPSFAKIQDNNISLKNNYFLMIRALSMTMFPILFGMAAVAPIFIPVYLGPGWSKIVPILQLLLFGAAAQSISNPISSLLLAKGRADLTFRWNAARFVIQVPLVWLGATIGGLIGVASTILVLQLIYFAASYRLLIHNILGPYLKQYLKSIYPSMIISTLMLLVVVSLPKLTGSLENPLLLIAQVAIGALVFFALIIIFQKPQYSELKNVLIGR